MVLRGGTSKGAYFLADDLPADPAARDALILSRHGFARPAAGRRHRRRPSAHQQGGDRVALDRRPDCDIDFLFGQVALDEPRIDVTPNCGNILAGIGPFAIERGLVRGARSDDPRQGPHDQHGHGRRAHGGDARGGRVAYGGDARIDGVPGTAAPIAIEFLDAAGSVCGALLPTGRAVDRVAGVDATLIDNGMPVVVLEPPRSGGPATSRATRSTRTPS